jgi:hypothetical protein
MAGKQAYPRRFNIGDARGDWKISRILMAGKQAYPRRFNIGDAEKTGKFPES